MKTVLYPEHCALGAKVVEFAGWQMPIQYKGIIAEHRAVRNAVGIFDVSHMGRLKITGEDAERFLDYLSTNKIQGRPNLSATYTVLPHENGGTVDDAIIYKENDKSFFIVVNAGNREKDLAHIKKQASTFQVHIQDRYKEEGILAVQGPLAAPLAERLFPEANTLRPMRFTTLSYQGRPLILSATGYTGAGGFEIYASIEQIPDLWKTFLNEGKEFGIEPCGLGCRDTLRLEMGYALYGHELTDTISANESVSAWTIKWDRDFLGKEAMLNLEKKAGKRMEYGILLQEGIPREGCTVRKNGEEIGKITSGTFSPSLQKGIGILLSKESLNLNEIVQVEIRQKSFSAKVVGLPFIDTKK